MSTKGLTMVQEDENWKSYIRAEDDSGRIWKHMWGWILDNYRNFRAVSLKLREIHATKMAKKSVNMVEQDENWKAYIRAEDDSGSIWRHMWGWMIENYNELKKKLDEKTEQSVFLSGVREEVKEDPRKLNVPESVNHEYGWVAKEEEFRLQKYGCDYFRPIPLPDIYKLIK